MKNRDMSAEDRLFGTSFPLTLPSTRFKASEINTNKPLRLYGGVTVTQAIAVHVGGFPGHPAACIETLIGTIDASGLPFKVQAFSS